MALSQVSTADGQDERVAGGPAHESEHHRVLRVGGCVFLEEQRPGTHRTWPVLRRLAVRADPDSPQGAHRGVREQCLSPHREGSPKSAASSRRSPAHFLSDIVHRALLSDSFHLHQPSRAHRSSELLPHRADDSRAVPAGLRSASAVRRQSERVAPRITAAPSACLGRPVCIGWLHSEIRRCRWRKQRKPCPMDITRSRRN